VGGCPALGDGVREPGAGYGDVGPAWVSGTGREHPRLRSVRPEPRSKTNLVRGLDLFSGGCGPFFEGQGAARLFEGDLSQRRDGFKRKKGAGGGRGGGPGGGGGLAVLALLALGAPPGRSRPESERSPPAFFGRPPEDLPSPHRHPATLFSGFCAASAIRRGARQALILYLARPFPTINPGSKVPYRDPRTMAVSEAWLARILEAGPAAGQSPCSAASVPLMPRSLVPRPKQRQHSRVIILPAQFLLRSPIAAGPLALATPGTRPKTVFTICRWRSAYSQAIHR